MNIDFESNWKKACTEYPIGSLITGKVILRTRFGVFLDIGMVGVLALAEVTEFADAPDYPSDLLSPDAPLYEDNFPEIGKVLTGIVLAHKTHDRQIAISLKLEKRA